MSCLNCGSDHRTSELSPGGIITKCGGCGMVLGNAGQLSHRDDDDEAELAPVRRAPAPAAVAPRRQPKAQDAAPANPVPAMKARLRWLDGEIKRLRKLEAEREQLARILSAASGKPVAVVRELKRSHG